MGARAVRRGVRRVLRCGRLKSTHTHTKYIAPLFRRMKPNHPPSTPNSACTRAITVPWSIPPSGVARESSGPGGALSYLLLRSTCFRDVSVRGFGWAGDKTNAAKTKAATDEVEAVIDTVFHHPNTAPFIEYRLIERMVTSNPSEPYARAVAQAFTTGHFNGKRFSGRYGDLAAAAAAIVLHPKARAGKVGKLREPNMKIAHFLP